MAELVNLANGRVDLLFHETPKKFNRIEPIPNPHIHMYVQVNRNDAICDVFFADENENLERDAYMLNLVKGNPFEIGKSIIIDELSACYR